MKEKIKYTDEPIGKVKVISDFLPSPEELALKDETVKVTIALSKTSVDFFKKEAKKYNTQYQKIIRRLLVSMLLINNSIHNNRLKVTAQKPCCS